MRTKTGFILVWAVLLMLLLAGCQTADNPQPPADAAYYSFTDSLGRNVTLQSRPQRVAAISGSYAHIWQLAGGELAAATQDAWEDDRLDLGEQVTDIGSLKAPSVETILEQNIDFILLSSKIAEHMQVADQLEKLGIACAYFEVEVFEDYLDMLKICTDITDRPDLYEQNGAEIQAQIEAAAARSQGEAPPTVLLVRAHSTGVRVLNSRNMTGAMLKELGCVNIADQDGALLENLSIEKIIEQNPDFIFFVTMGASEEKALQSMQSALEDNPAFSSLSAVKNKRYMQLPKALFHLKPNNRWGESYEFLADILYPAQTA
jgi:ABC-type Fe3+-hydroxamate transport system substrate-binding protein